MSIAAQQLATVTGKAVHSTSDGTGLPSQVTLTSVNDPNITFNVKTDDDGRFVFENVPPGKYRIAATSVAFSSGAIFGEDRVTIVPGQNPPITVIVGANLIRESVSVSANRSQPLEQVSKTVNVIEGQEMRDRADFTLIDTVRTIPGFRVQQLGGFGRTASIKARGLRNQDTAVLIDGIRFRDPGSITGDATPFLSDFTLTSVDRIEVLRGSGSSLYGTNAIGGTLDFQTQQPREGFHGQLSGAAGGYGLGRFRGNVSYGTSDNRFGISGAVSRTAYTKGIDGNDNAGNTNVQSRIEFNPTSRTNFSGRFFVSDAKVRLNVSPDTLGTLPPTTTIIDAEEGVNFIADADDPDSIQKSRFFSGQFVATHVVNNNFVISGYYQGLVTNRSNDDGLLGPGFQSEFTSKFGGAIHTANIHGIWTPNASNTFTGGYEFESEKFKNEGGAAIGTTDFTTNAGQTSHTLYAQHLLSLLEGRLQFAGGARAQWFSLGTPEFSEPDGPYADTVLSNPPAAYTFDGSASYFISQSKTKFRVHAGNGYRVPSLYERFGTFYFFGFNAQGNPGLKPERSFGFDAGVEQYFADNKVKASGTYFYTRIKDEITYLPTADFAYYNADRHYSRGAEFSLDVRPTKSTDIFTSYTFTNSDIRNFRGGPMLASSDRKTFGIPDHQFTLVVTQRIKRFWVSLDVLATSSYLAPVFSSSTFNQYTYRFDGNGRADLTAGYTFPLRRDGMSLRLFGTVENLFDNEYFENGFRTIGVNGRVGLAFSF